MKILIAIMSCSAYRARAEACRETWAGTVDPATADVRFFFGKGTTSQHEDEMVLDVPDDYRNFPLKVQAMRRYAYDRGYDMVYKADDDSYVRPERLLQAVPEGQDYVGRLRGPSGNYPAPYCSGFGYWLSRRAIEKLLTVEWNGDIAEDRFTANALLQFGIRPCHDPRYSVVWSKANALSGREAPLQGNKVIAACEYGPNEMRAVHFNFTSGVASKADHGVIQLGPLSRVNIMIKTFLRDGYMFAATRGIKKYFPECRMIVVDDGHESYQKISYYAELQQLGHSVAWLPFDSGFGDKANEAIRHADGEYVLIGSDDFEFTPLARAGVEKMVKVLDAVPSIGVVSGRVDGKPYESCFEREPGTIREVKRYHGEGEVDGVKYKLCDLTVNYSLVRRKLFEEPESIRWDGGEVKIGGGEHGAFFLDVQKAGWAVAVIEDAHIYQLKPNSQWQAKDYPSKRARAKQPGRPCLKKRGIDRWICQDGRVETC